MDNKAVEELIIIIIIEVALFIIFFINYYLLAIRIFDIQMKYASATLIGSIPLFTLHFFHTIFPFSFCYAREKKNKNNIVSLLFITV